jgi:hypothetical protein
MTDLLASAPLQLRAVAPAYFVPVVVLLLLLLERELIRARLGAQRAAVAYRVIGLAVLPLLFLFLLFVGLRLYTMIG